MYELTTKHARLLIDEKMGGRAARWQIADLQVLKPMTDKAVIGGWYAMAPWAGRISDNRINFKQQDFPQEKNLDEWAIHGTVFYDPGNIEQISNNELVVTHKTSAAWLAPGEIIQTWLLDDEFLFTSIEIKTLGEPFPASCGWHPWFLRNLSRGMSANYKIGATGKYERGDDYLPTGKIIEVGDGPFDDALVVPQGDASIIWPGALEMNVESNCPVFVLYDLPDDSFCIEPSSGYPDQINRDPIVVTKEKSLKIESTWRVKLL